MAANDGNISVRTGKNEVWATPTGVSKGFMKKKMLVKVNLDGNVLEGTYKPSSELKMHLRAHRENETLRSVCHAHRPSVRVLRWRGLCTKGIRTNKGDRYEQLVEEDREQVINLCKAFE